MACDAAPQARKAGIIPTATKPKEQTMAKKIRKTGMTEMTDEAARAARYARRAEGRKAVDEFMQKHDGTSTEHPHDPVEAMLEEVEDTIEVGFYAINKKLDAIMKLLKAKPK
jgi:hypothetical protein